MPAACRSSCRTACSASWSIAACRRPTAKPGGRSRAPPRRIRPSCSTTRRRAAFSKAARSSACSARRSSAARPTSRSPARTAATPSILRASHDGYADRFSVIHQRALKLAPAGNRIDGEDLFVAGRRRHASRRTSPDEFAVRFHLHPSVKANKLTDGHGAMLMLPNRDVWTFNAYEDRVEIEESVYLVRHRRAAPRRADRDLRPRPQGAARALDLRCHVASSGAVRREPHSAATSPNCRCDAPSSRPRAASPAR